MSFFAELRRRNVFKVALAYVLVAWLILQAGDVLGPALRLPEWSNSLLAFFLVLGFPLALVFAWAFELTPEGFKPEKPSATSKTPSAKSGRLLDAAVIALLLIAAGYFFWEARIAKPLTDVQSAESQPAESGIPDGSREKAAPVTIAVLPFANVSDDESKDYFADGMTEEIMNALITIPGLSVPARTTVFAFKDKQSDIKDIGRALGVAHIVEGSVRSVGEQARITVSLVTVSDGVPIWSQTYERRLSNIFAVQDEIAAAVAEKLQVEFGDTDTIPNRTSDMLAYDSYLQGLAALRKRDRRAIELFTEATQIDPDFAPAWAGLALAQSTQPSIGAETILRSAQRALELDPRNVDAMTAIASAFRQARRWRESEDYFKRALAIDPGSAELLEDYAEFLNLVGRSREALDVATRGMAIDPRIQPLVAAYAEALLSEGMPGPARQAVLDSLRDHGDIAGLWWASLPLWLASADDMPLPTARPGYALDAYHYLRDALQTPDDTTIDALKSVLAHGVNATNDLPLNRRSARLLLLYFDEVDFVIEQDILSPQRFPSPAREWLWSPLFRDYRSHPRFPQFLANVQLTDYWDATDWPAWCEHSAGSVINCQ